MLREKKRERRSDCPINFAVETFGDKWSLIIVRDIVFWGKKTYGEFLKSEERIATNILTDRLALLEREDILRKTPHATDKRKDIYLLTEKGLDLIPLLIEMVLWSSQYDVSKTTAPDAFEEQARKKFIEQIRKNKKKMVEQVRETVSNGGYVFSGG